MAQIKKIFLGILAVVLVVVACVWMFNPNLEHIEDTNGAENYSLQQITDENIINMDVGALNFKKATTLLSDMPTYSSDKFTGVAEIFVENMVANRYDITVYNTVVNSGNFKIALVYNDEIVHEFKLNELMQTYTLKNVKGTVSLRIAGESADFKFSYDVI